MKYGTQNFEFTTKRLVKKPPKSKWYILDTSNLFKNVLKWTRNKCLNIVKFL